MGNWRTVDMKGHIDVKDVENICGFLEDDSNCGVAWPFTMGLSLCGLNQWVNDDGSIDAVGNLYERDIDNDDIERALGFLAQRYPSLELTLHSGSDWECSACSATFHVKDGFVKRCKPEVEEIRELVPMTVGEYLKREGKKYGRY